MVETKINIFFKKKEKQHTNKMVNVDFLDLKRFTCVPFDKMIISG